jgi:predicted alpha/beta hydrolase family esterase
MKRRLMKRIFIVHGWSGRPDSGWLLWIKKELSKNHKYKVYSLNMPDKDYPKISKWINHLKKSAGILDNDTYFIGHSIGCQAILRYLEKQKNIAGGAVFVAGWFKVKGLEDDGKKIIRPWMKKVNLSNVKKRLLKSVALFSDNDPYVSLSDTKYFKELGSKIIIQHNKGHFIENKTLKIPVVLKEIKSLMK